MKETLPASEEARAHIKEFIRNDGSIPKKYTQETKKKLKKPRPRSRFGHGYKEANKRIRNLEAGQKKLEF